MCRPRRFLLVGDSKLISYGNVAAMTEAGVEFIAPASKAYVRRRQPCAASDQMATIDGRLRGPRATRPSRQAERGSYRVAEDTLVLAKPSKGDGVASCAGCSSGPRRCRGRRHRPTEEAGPGPRRPRAPRRRARGPPLPDAVDKVTARVAVIAKDRRVGDYLRHQLGTDDDGQARRWSGRFDQDTIDHEAATDGWYCLLTNLARPRPTPARCSSATRAKKSSSAATAPSKARSPSHPCS